MVVLVFKLSMCLFVFPINQNLCYLLFAKFSI
jgi:hypothetical protein